MVIAMPTIHRVSGPAVQPKCQLCREEPAVAELGEERTPIGQSCIDEINDERRAGAES